MKVETKTKTGIDVTLRINGYDIFADTNIPQLGGKISIMIDGWRSDKKAVMGKIWYTKEDVTVGLTIPEEDYRKVEIVVNEKKAADVEKAKSLSIIGLKYEIGCDNPSNYSLIYEDNDLLFQAMTERYKIDEKLIAELKKMDLNAFGKRYGAERIEATFTTYGGYSFNTEQFEIIRSEMKKAIERKNKIIEEEKVRMEKKKTEIFDKAAKTGERQILCRWTDDCNDPWEECDTDIMITYAMADGSEVTERNHTW